MPLVPRRKRPDDRGDGGDEGDGGANVPHEPLVPMTRRPMSREDALNLIIDFGRAYGRKTGRALPVELKRSADGQGYDVKIPAESLPDLM